MDMSFSVVDFAKGDVKSYDFQTT